MRRSFIALALTAAVFVGGAAGAHHLPVDDDSDERGLLDIKSVNVQGMSEPRWKIDTWARWTRTDIWDAGYFLVYLDTFGGEHYDYYALVRSTGRRLRGTLVRHRKERPDYSVGKVLAWKPDRRSAAVQIPLDKMKRGENRATYAWYVESVFSGSRCRRVCFDWAPDAASEGEGVREPFPVIE